MKKIFLIVGVLILLFLGWYFVINTKPTNTPSSEVQTTEIPKPIKQIKKADLVVTSESTVSETQKTSLQQNIQKNTSDSEEKEPFERIQVKDDRVEFYDEDGRIINYIERLPVIPHKQWSAYYYSNNKKYIAINNVSNFDGRGEFIEKANLKIYSQSGKVIWGLNNNSYYSLFLSPDGKYILGSDAYSSSPIYYNNINGKEIKIQKESILWEKCFSEDGDFFSIYITNFENIKIINKKATDTNGKVLIYNHDGNLIKSIDHIVGAQTTSPFIMCKNHDIILNNGIKIFEVSH